MLNNSKNNSKHLNNKECLNYIKDRNKLIIKYHKLKYKSKINTNIMINYLF